MRGFHATSLTHKFHPLTTACVMPMPKSNPTRCSAVMMRTLPIRISGPTGNTLLRREFRNLWRKQIMDGEIWNCQGLHWHIGHRSRNLGSDFLAILRVYGTLDGRVARADLHAVVILFTI